MHGRRGYCSIENNRQPQPKTFSLWYRHFLHLHGGTHSFDVLVDIWIDPVMDDQTPLLEVAPEVYTQPPFLEEDKIDTDRQLMWEYVCSYILSVRTDP